MAFLKFPFKKEEKVKDFLLIEIGLEVVNMAKLTTEGGPKIQEVGSRNFSSVSEMFNASLEAIDELAGKTQEIPKKAIIGVSGGSIKTETTVAQYTRPDPKEPISGEEVAKVLEEVSGKGGIDSFKLFFSTIASATLDGTKVSNPIGLKGEKAALSCFIAYKDPEELAVFDKLINEIDMELEKIIPTSFAVTKTMLKKGDENALILRVGKGRCEATFLSKGHISEITQFDLGTGSPDLFLTGFEVVLEKLIKESTPELVWLYPDNQEIDVVELKERLRQFNWKNAGVDKSPSVEVEEAATEEVSKQVGLQALSTEALE